VEKRLRVGGVVADPWSGERAEYPKLLQSGFQGGCPHGVAVIDMEDQRLGPTFADPLTQAGPADEIKGQVAAAFRQRSTCSGNRPRSLQ